MLESIINIFFRKKCIFCKSQINERGTCRKCLNIIKYNKESIKKCSGAYFDIAISALYYEGKFKKMMHKFKFANSKYLATGFADLIYQKILKHNINADIIIPVPISKKRYYERGYNQSELIVKSLSKMTKIKYNNDILVKIKDNERQSELPEEKRQKNVQNVYKVKNSDLIQGHSLILVDDIFTTGSTVNECSRVLKNAGATKIIVMTVMYTRLKRDIL